MIPASRFVTREMATEFLGDRKGDLYYDPRTKMWLVELSGAFGASPLRTTYHNEYDLVVNQALNGPARGLPVEQVNCRNCGAPKPRHVCDYCKT